ncbi:uncharacterized protein TNCV_1044811 [Trichonephila clavipes]|nr:uncharacterized protein TNCV_1044811 [Trichonephila clavipes]
MRQAIWAIYCHYRSTDDEPMHHFCPIGDTSWCKYQKAVATNSASLFKHKNIVPIAIMDEIKPIIAELSAPKLLKKCGGRVITSQRIRKGWIAFITDTPPNRESSWAPNPDSADFVVFLVRFAEGTLLGLPKKISLFAIGGSQRLSLKKIGSLRGAHTSTLQNTIFYRCQGLQHSTLQNAKSSSDSLTFLIYPLLSHLIRSHYPLMFCLFSAPVGLGSFELLSLSRPHRFRRIPAIAPWAPMSGCFQTMIVCFQACCGHRIGSKQNTLWKRLFVTPRTKFRNSSP